MQEQLAAATAHAVDVNTASIAASDAYTAASAKESNLTTAISSLDALVVKVQNAKNSAQAALTTAQGYGGTAEQD